MPLLIRVFFIHLKLRLRTQRTTRSSSSSSARPPSWSCLWQRRQLKASTCRKTNCRSSQSRPILPSPSTTTRRRSSTMSKVEWPSSRRICRLSSVHRRRLNWFVENFHFVTFVLESVLTKIAIVIHFFLNFVYFRHWLELFSNVTSNNLLISWISNLWPFPV